MGVILKCPSPKSIVRQKEDRAVRGRFLDLRFGSPRGEERVVAGRLLWPPLHSTLALALRTLPSAGSLLLRMRSAEHVSPLLRSCLPPSIQ